MTTLEDLVSLAPLHQPTNLAVIRTITERKPGLPQVACFDSSFDRTQPRVAQCFALPRSMTDKGIIRYGFHGLSYQFIASALPDVAGSFAEQRVIVAHLGNGSSLCAMKNRQGVSSTMGFTAGIGENCATVRRSICERLAWLGVTLDLSSNESNATLISDGASSVQVYVIPTDEEAVIADAVCAAVM